MNKLKFFIFFIFCFIFSCHLQQITYVQNPFSNSNHKIIPVHLDTAFNKDDQNKIQDALDHWNYALNGTLELKIVDAQFDMDPVALKHIINDQDILILKINHTHPLVERSDLAFTDEFHIVYIIRERIDDSSLTNITVHELGHALGAKHSNNGVMEPYYDSSDIQCIDQDTMKQIALVQNLKIENLNYCIID